MDKTICLADLVAARDALEELFFGPHPLAGARIDRLMDCTAEFRAQVHHLLFTCNVEVDYVEEPQS